jgi:hypothetical protein
MKGIMSWISLRTLPKLLVINILVLLVSWMTIEFFYYLINPFNKESHRIQCRFDWVLYNYCSNITALKKNTKADGGKAILTFTNNIGQRVRAKNGIINDKADHIFIGDSFIQADEMEYDLTFYSLLEQNMNVTAIGYSSWNIIQYADAIKKLSIKDSHYHVFLMPNDVTPLYDRSVYHEKISNVIRTNDYSVPVGRMLDLKQAFSNSLTKMIYQIIFNEKPTKTESSLSVFKSNDFSIDKVDDCSPLHSIPKEYSGVLGYDYLIYSKSSNCWNGIHKAAANEALVELRKLNSLVESLGSQLTVYMIPPGWSFVDQNTNGRKANAYYFFDDKMTVTTEPLLKFFSDSLPAVKFISLELLINKWMSDCENCKNKFYLSDDGHWTPETHKKIAQYFLRSLEKSNKLQN